MVRSGWAWMLTAVAATVVAAVGVSGAADFRVENSVFVDKEEEPCARSSTIFHRGVVYDFLEEPAEVTIFDPAGGRFILLDVDRKLRTDLSPTVLRQAIDRLKRLAEADQDPKVRFLANPVFQQSVDEATGELVFTSESMDYRVLGVRADSEEMVNQYREFCDWYARLNTFLRPGSRPPFARLMVNEALARRGEIPSRIVLVLRSRRALGTHEERLRGEHRLMKCLVESDLRRIAQAGEQMAAFKKVGFGQYEESRRPKEPSPDK